MNSVISLLTPNNLGSEREKFLTSATYNPIFHYAWQDEPLQPNFSSEGRNILWEAVKSQDHIAITQAASNFFEVEIRADVLERAKKTAQQPGQIAEGSAQEIALLFNKAFEEFELDYTVKIVPEPGFNVRPQHGVKKLLISEHIHFEYFSMEGEVRHELVHIIRQLNSKYNEIKRSQNYLPTEEGLAAWCQDMTNDDRGQAQHAIEYIASSVGVKSSLREIYDCMRDMGMSENLAWKRASRHKFGFIDTSLPGDILKPAMYFANEEKIGTLTTNEKLRLFVGKIALNELDKYPSYKGLWPDQKIREYFKL